MGFKQVRSDVLSALEEGRIQHEARDEVDEKNLLLTGEVTAEQVARLIKACRGTQYEISSHHLDPSIDVHIFKPEARVAPGADTKCWYIKLYLLDPDVWFISVHESKGVSP